MKKTVVFSLMLLAVFLSFAYQFTAITGEKQLKITEQIVSAITELSSAMNDTLEGTKRIESVAGNLNTVSRRLTEIVGRYRT